MLAPILVMTSLLVLDAQDEPPKDTIHGIVYMIDGVGGFGFAPRSTQRALEEAKVQHELRHFYWSHGLGRWYDDLTDEQQLSRKASELADSLVGYRVRHPHSPIFIIAKSGGTAVALAALSELPPDSVDRVILLSAAVAPDIDLSRALQAVRVDLTSFWSPRDKVILGVGTTLFGTAGGDRGKAAGLIGFKIPADLSAEQMHDYQKLKQVKWTPDMKATKNLGTHIGTSMPGFIKKYVAPLLTNPPASN